MADVISFNEISGHANIALGMAKLVSARLRERSPFLARLIADWKLVTLHHELAEMVRGVASIEPDLVSSTLAGEFLTNHQAIGKTLLPLVDFLKADGHWYERSLASKMEAAWGELEDFAESLQLSHSQELIDTLGQVASSIPGSPDTPAQDWRTMLAKL
ncbi:MAG: hypothetical protein HY766_09550 [candidate division NC10 bacterium]|nr:hypothetical protein [candidate division NC10 bacterium]MBI4839690.1 hypothetical protein [candidate division NC10 bacterium]